MNPGLIPGLQPEEVGTHRFRDYAVRFVFGAAIALVAGLIGTAFGPKLGGVFLAFPAILPASLTLIQEKEGKEQASIDSIGAVLGAIAMIAFAMTVFLSVTSWGVVPSVGFALSVWLGVAVALYFLVAGIFGREPAPP